MHHIVYAIVLQTNPSLWIQADPKLCAYELNMVPYISIICALNLCHSNSASCGLCVHSNIAFVQRTITLFAVKVVGIRDGSYRVQFPV